VQLRREGTTINRKAVQRHMREMGIAGICPGPNLSQRNLAHRVYLYLLRQVTAAYPNHVWGIDITYIRLQKGWLYLVAVLDWSGAPWARYVVSCRRPHQSLGYLTPAEVYFANTVTIPNVQQLLL